MVIIQPILQATIMTDPSMADRTYVGPMNPELVEQILEKVLAIGQCLFAVVYRNCACLIDNNYLLPKDVRYT